MTGENFIEYLSGGIKKMQEDESIFNAALARKHDFPEESAGFRLSFTQWRPARKKTLPTR
jgi:hypothetical protein